MSPSTPASRSIPNPIQLEVMANALAGIAEEMGARLIRSAYSSNIKERRDCSTALFDAAGHSIAQAAHIPVHLGALSDAVQAVIQQQPQAGEVYLLNDPFQGGSHLPDLTLVTAIPSITDPDQVGAYAVSRAHHADVGGMRPGSMPADSTEIWQEGLIIPPVCIARSGVDGFVWNNDILKLILANVRHPKQRRGDLHAQAGANWVGVQRFQALLQEYGETQAWSLIQAVMEHTERRIRAHIQALPDGIYRAEDVLEGDHVQRTIHLEVTIQVEQDHIRIDFDGTDAAVPSNLNAPFAVTRSAALFALRCLLDPTAPSNAGIEAPITIIAPEGCLVHAQPPVAVVAGNVETSQRIADLILTALASVAGERAIAQGQGTMNNLILGNAHFTYYETIGGGQGASSKGPGLDGVHVGMSNTLNTPIEALELEYPLRLVRYELRDHSGGSGEQRGGQGVIRSIQVLQECTLSLLTDRRHHTPQGAQGGSAGTKGVNEVNGTTLPSKSTRHLHAGDVVTVYTPGGGGWGQAHDSPEEDHP